MKHAKTSWVLSTQAFASTSHNGVKTMQQNSLKLREQAGKGN